MQFTIYISIISFVLHHIPPRLPSCLSQPQSRQRYYDGPARQQTARKIPQSNPCSRSLLETYSYRPSSTASTAVNLARRSRTQINKKPGTAYHPDRTCARRTQIGFERTAVRILRLSASPPHPLLLSSGYNFSFAEPHSRPCGIAWGLLSRPSAIHALNQAHPFWTLCLASPVSCSSLSLSNCLSYL